jgi:pimeloyl-ACP methyl ester carboxylesterase
MKCHDCPIGSGVTPFGRTACLTAPPAAERVSNAHVLDLPPPGPPLRVSNSPVQRLTLAHSRWRSAPRGLALVCVAAALAAPAGGQAPATPAPGASPCQERVNDDGTAALLPRLAGLRYDCVRLQQGARPVLVGRAGPPGAPLVVLVHGLGQNAHRDWAPVVAALAQRFQVATVDLPGFGASPPPGQAYDVTHLGALLARLVDRLAPDQRVHVVGHSLGAALSLAFAHRHADRVDRLVLVDAAGILLKPAYVRAMARQRLPQLGLPPLDRLLRSVESRVNDLGSLLLLGRDDRYDFLPWLARNPDVRQALLGGLVQVDAAIGLVEHDFTAAIRETRAPTTLIWGRDDRIAPLRTGQLLAARLPQARLRVMDAAGHTPMLDRPDEFNTLLLAALAGPAPQRAPGEPLPAGSQGDVECLDQDEVFYSGRFDRLMIERCGRVSIERAQIGQLVVNGSTVSIANSSIAMGKESGNDRGDDKGKDNGGVALVARDSDITATHVQIDGRVAIRTDNSVFDMAGVSLKAREQGVEVLGNSPSRLFFSVSDWSSRDYRGDAHFLWPRSASGP